MSKSYVFTALLIMWAIINAVSGDDYDPCEAVTVKVTSGEEAEGDFAQSVDCSVDPHVAGWDHVTNLVLKAHDPCGAPGVYFGVAAADRYSYSPHMQLETDDSDEVKLTGGLSLLFGEMSSLKLSWNVASASGWSFRCYAYGVTPYGEAVTLSKTVPEEED